MSIEIYSNDEFIIKICHDYWQIDNNGEFIKTATQIAKENNISINETTNISKKYSVFHSEDIFCTICGVAYIYKSRSEFKNTKNFNTWTCGFCKNQAAQKEIDSKLEILNNKAKKFKEQKIDLKTISPNLLVYLAAFFRFATDEDLQTTLPFSSIKELRFSPNESINTDILREIYKENLICLSPLSDLSKINIHDDGTYSFYLNEVRFITPSENPINFINDLEDYISSSEFIINNKKEIEILAYEISRQECLFYLLHVLDEHGLNYSPGEKTILVIDKCLKEFSVAQIYNFIWRAGKDAAAFYLRHPVSKDHAAKTVVGNIERQYEKALSNDWEVKPYRRNYYYPQSVLSSVLFNSILKTDDGGFDMPIKKIFEAYCF